MTCAPLEPSHVYKRCGRGLEPGTARAGAGTAQGWIIPPDYTGEELLECGSEGVPIS